MKDNLEKRLQRLRECWPSESVAPGVTDEIAKGLNSDAIGSPQANSSNQLVEDPLAAGKSVKWTAFLPIHSPLGALVGALALACVGVWMVAPNALNGLLQTDPPDAWYMRIETPNAEDAVVEIWADRKLGIRVEEPRRVLLDDGEHAYSWDPADESSKIFKRPTSHVFAFYERMVNLELPENQGAERIRMEGRDSIIGNEPCKAYSISLPEDSGYRVVLWINKKGWVRSFCMQTKSEGDWLDQSNTTVDYKREIHESRFQLKNRDSRSILDVSQHVESRFDRELVHKVKDGLRFAIHDCVRIDEGCYFVLSSVKGTPEYLEKYPPKKEWLNSEHMHTRVAFQNFSHGSAGSNSQVGMTEFQFQGVHYQWRILILDEGNEPRNGAEEGSIEIPLDANHWHEEKRDDGVLGYTYLSVTCPVSDELPMEQMVARFRDDMDLLSIVHSGEAMMRVHGAIRDESVQFVDLQTLSDQEYGFMLQKARWQLLTGDWTGKDPPADYLFPQPKEQQEWVDPRLKFPDSLVQLPERAMGKIVSVEGKPIQGASVVVTVRHFGDGDPVPQSVFKAVTDIQGVYELALNGKIHPRRHEVQIFATADGFSCQQFEDYEMQILSGQLPEGILFRGKRLKGRIVDKEGRPQSKVVIRWFSNNQDMTRRWGTGPMPVSEEGVFDLNAPLDSKIVAVVYPEANAPRFIELNTGDFNESVISIGDVMLEEGVVHSGRVLDRSGNGVANTVVGVRSVEYREMYGFIAFIGDAVKTNSEGRFQLPPLANGKYRITVSDAAPLFSKQMQLTGEKPPQTEEYILEVGRDDPERELLLRETN